MKTRYKVMLSIISFLLLIVTSLGASYSIWVVNKEQATANTFSVADCFSLTFSEQTSSVSLRSAYPMSNKRAALLSPYTFTIENQCNADIPYKIVLNTLTTSVSEPTMDVINDNYIRLSLDGNATVEPTDLDDLTTITNPTTDSNVKSSYVIYSGTLNANSTSKTYSLRLWVNEEDDSSTTNPDGSVIYGTNVMNKVFEAKLTVEANSGY